MNAVFPARTRFHELFHEIVVMMNVTFLPLYPSFVRPILEKAIKPVSLCRQAKRLQKLATRLVK